jgi:hypothetical protein
MLRVFNPRRSLPAIAYSTRMETAASKIAAS